MKKVRWGILGAGNIAHRFAKALNYVEEAELYAIAVRNPEKGEKFCQEFPCSKIYLDYDEFLNDDKIDCVYLSLPHFLHHQYAIKTLKKKKYVLCEKPATISLKEMEEIANCAKENDVFFMEAMKQRFVPLYQTIKKESLKLGKINRVTAKFCRIENDGGLDSYYYNPCGGGCLLDTGIYCASWLDDFSTGEISLISAEKRFKHNVDNYNKAILKANDVELVLENGKDIDQPVNVLIEGEKGYIEVYNHHRPVKMIEKINGIEDTIEIPYDHDDFYSEIKHVNDAYINGKKESEIMPLNASIRCAQIIELIKNN